MVSDAGSSHGTANRRALRWLALVCVLLVIHGSLYPWRFAWPVSFAAAWEQMLHQGSWWTGRGDVVGNVVLFLPVGVLGWALLRHSALAPPLRAAWVVGLGFALAFVLQVAQIFVPARSAAWSDVVWNMLGLLLGLLLAAPVSRLPIVRWRVHALPLAFVLLWLVLQCWPLVPRLDWQHIKDALKPLLLFPQWRSASAIDAALGLTLVGLLLRPLRWRALWLPALPLAAACGALLVDGQVLSLPRSVGWLVGVLAAAMAWRLPARPGAALGAALALLWFTFDELKPFHFADTLGEFHWLPFAASLQGSLSANTLALTWQLFWLGVVMVLLHGIGARLGPLALALSAWALLLELVQRLLPGRTADITPALLPWLWLLMLPPLQVSSVGAVTKSVLRVQINPPTHAP